MTKIRTKKFFVVGNSLYPASDRPPECSLKDSDTVGLEPQEITFQMLTGGFKLCVAECDIGCEITIA